jgi:hypothetical protein
MTYLLACLDLGGRLAHIDLGVMVPPAQGWKVTHPDSELAMTPDTIKGIIAECSEDALKQAGLESKKSRTVCQVNFSLTSCMGHVLMQVVVECQ